MNSIAKSFLVIALVGFFFPTISIGQDDPKGVDAVKHKQTVDKGIEYLLGKGQNPRDGSFSSHLSPAVTSMCVSALVRNGVPVQTAKIQLALKYVLSHVKEDGGIYAKGSNLRNYETSLAVMCLVDANQNSQYDEVIDKAAAFIKGIQWDESEGHDRASAFYGGWGYGKHKRPDVSNTQFGIDALVAAGVDPKSTEMQKALEFMSNSQNLSSQHNGADFATKATKDDEGGMIYSPANGGETKAGESESGGLRSYASMTYAGLKSFLHAGLTKEDMRVKAAFDWIQRHYDLDTNPGMGAQGLFYYYHVFAKALSILGDRTLVDAEGNVHNWRAELVEAVASRQQKDGSWTNVDADRWFEADKNLVTAYALLSLSYCAPEMDMEVKKEMDK